MKREELIKKELEKIADKEYGAYDEHDYTDHSRRNLCRAVYEKGLIDGVKWADEHPKSPWRDASVEKPPYDTDCDDETSVYVIVRQEQGNVLEAYYDYDNNDWRDREHNWRLQDPTHWMPTPELPKGGKQ